jgi:hypothetical protein
MPRYGSIKLAAGVPADSGVRRASSRAARRPRQEARTASPRLRQSLRLRGLRLNVVQREQNPDDLLDEFDRIESIAIVTSGE